MPNAARLSHKTKLGLAAVGLLLVGGAAGAGAIQATRPSIEMAPMAPVAIARLSQTSGLITLRGRVNEVYGNKFVLQDESGKTLVDLGPRGDRETLVSPGAAETIQGRYDRGFVHASFLVDGSGDVTELGPLGRPHPSHDGPTPPGGPDRAPSGEPDGVGLPPPAGMVPPPPIAQAQSSSSTAPGIAAPSPGAR